jgi:TPP-dependent trihydroxycyclohexane-1,2-dione (THcHDO) dehydratase
MHGMPHSPRTHRTLRPAPSHDSEGTVRRRRRTSDGGYQSIHSLQLATVGASFGNEFRIREDDDGAPAGETIDVDYAALARALGCRAWRAETLEELDEALTQARSAPGPAVIECRVEPRRMLLGSGAWWDLGVAQQADDPRTLELASAQRDGVTAQRYFG